MSSHRKQYDAVPSPKVCTTVLYRTIVPKRNLANNVTCAQRSFTATYRTTCTIRLSPYRTYHPTSTSAFTENLATYRHPYAELRINATNPTVPTTVPYAQRLSPPSNVDIRATPARTTRFSLPLSLTRDPPSRPRSPAKMIASRTRYSAFDRQPSNENRG